MAQVFIVYALVCLLGFAVYALVNLILWCIGGIEEDEDEE